MMELFSLENHFYHGSVRRYVALFGNIFSNIHIKRKSSDETREDVIKVPIRYGAGNMYLKVAQDATRETNQISKILPAMSYQIDNIYKDINRKTNPMNRIQNATYKSNLSGGETRQFQLNRIPYNFIFELVIRAKNTDDILQIVEQIIPSFDGNLSVSISDTTGVLTEQDIIISLQEITMEDNYSDEMQSRLIEWKITFELKGHLYKRTQTGLIIREIDLMAGPSIDDMTLIETISEQIPLQDEQVINSAFTALMGSIPSTPVKKITRTKKKKVE